MNNAFKKNQKKARKLDRIARVKKARELNEPKKIRVKKNKPTPKNPKSISQIRKRLEHENKVKIKEANKARIKEMKLDISRPDIKPSTGVS